MLAGQFRTISSATWTFSATIDPVERPAELMDVEPDVADEERQSPRARWCSTQSPVLGSRADSASRTTLLFEAALSPMTMQSYCRSALRSASNVCSVYNSTSQR